MEAGIRAMSEGRWQGRVHCMDREEPVSTWLAPGLIAEPGSKSGRPGRQPEEPSAFEERLAQTLLIGLSPKLPKVEPTPMPGSFLPCEDFLFDRQGEAGELAATWYPASTEQVRGAVLMVHPWHGRGRAYFHRHRRVPALRRAGYHVMTFDLGGVGESGPRPSRFYDRDVVDALHAFRSRARSEAGASLPLHLWGVCHGAYWAHLALARFTGIDGAFFEDTSLHLLDWSKRQAPWGLPFYLFFQHTLRRSYPYLDLRRQAPALRVSAAAYVSGARNTLVRPEETRELAEAAGWPARIIDDAGHLECVRRRAEEVTDFALGTFASAEGGRAAA